MGWKLKKTAWGLDFDVEIEDRPIVVQEIYDLKLEKLWTNKEFADQNSSKTFIAQALSWLPVGHFIIFFFDNRKDYFVQFFNNEGEIILDFPMWYGSQWSNKQKEFVNILRSLKFKRIYSRDIDESYKQNVFFDASKGRKKKQIRANFKENYSKEADLALLIAGKIYGFKKTGDFSYFSDQLMQEEE
jgi:hypothetical protein